MLPCLINQPPLTLALPYSILNFHEISNQNQLRLYENEVLQENNLIRLDIPRLHLLSSNIFRAISYSLYMTTIYEDFIKNLCIEALQNLMTQKLESIPKRLRVFYNNHQLFTDYCQDTTSPKFTLLSLELISTIFQAKIVIYEIDDNQYLRSTILNNFLESQLLLFKDRLGYFDHVESLVFMIKFQSLKTIVHNILEASMNKGEGKKYRRDSDKLFEELNRDIENEINPPETAEKKTEKGKTLVFSSTSLEFLENTTIDQTAEKQRGEQVFFNGSQAEAEFSQNWSGKNKSRDHSELWTPQVPTGYEKHRHELNEANEEENQKNKSLVLHETQKGASITNDIQNPFIIESHKVFNQRESPKFNQDDQPTKGLRQKKAKNIALKCTSEEFIIPIKPFDSCRQAISPQPYPFKKQPLVLEESKEKYLGTLKFFDEVKGYGFIIMDIDNSEIFVHFDDFIKTQGIQREMLMTYKLGNIIRVSFNCMKYIGKYNMSRKAVDVQVMSTSL